MLYAAGLDFVGSADMLIAAAMGVILCVYSGGPVCYLTSSV